MSDEGYRDILVREDGCVAGEVVPVDAIDNKDATISLLTADLKEAEKDKVKLNWSLDTEIKARVNMTDECARLRIDLAAARKVIEVVREWAKEQILKGEGE